MQYQYDIIKNNIIKINPTQPNHPLPLPSWNLTPMHRGKALSHHRPSNPIHYAWHIGVGMGKFSPPRDAVFLLVGVGGDMFVWQKVDFFETVE